MNNAAIEPSDAEKAADLAVWTEGHDARINCVYVNPYDAFGQRRQFAAWLAGFQAAQLSLKMDEELHPITDEQLAAIYQETWLGTVGAVRSTPKVKMPAMALVFARKLIAYLQNREPK